MSYFFKFSLPILTSLIITFLFIPNLALSNSGDEVDINSDPIYIFNSHGHANDASATCSGCHLGTGFNGSLGVAFPMRCQSIVHGTTENCTIGLNMSSATENGINMSVYNGNVEQTGIIAAADATLVSDVNGQELSHSTPQSANHKWDFDITGISTLGTYTLYYCINQVNGDNLAFDTADGSPVCGTDTIEITNNAPNAVNDHYSTINDLSVTESSSFTDFDMCANDSDSENDSFSYVSNTSLSGTGSLSRSSACNFSFDTNGLFETLDTGETATRTFTYTIQDSYGALYQDTATVTIQITGQNDAPILGSETETISISEGGTATSLLIGGISQTNVLQNDSDVDDAITVVYSPPTDTAPSNGSLTLNANGTFSYTHNGTATTSDSFTYRVTDGEATTTAKTVNITILALNDNPVAAADSITVTEGATRTVLDSGQSSVRFNDSDEETSTSALVVSVVTPPAFDSSFTLNTDGTFSYQHDGSQTSNDSFTYRVFDGAAFSANATVSITINNTNDSPIAVADTIITSQGQTETLLSTGQNNVTANDSDEEGTTLSVSLITDVTNGTLNLNANGTFSYIHDGTETTSDSFVYRASDGNSDANDVTVSISITVPNYRPVAVNDSINIIEGNTVTVLGSGQTSVTFNDTDQDGDTLTATITSGPSNASSFTLNPDGTFTYTHNGTQTSSDSFTYMVSDASLTSLSAATVSITITNTNDSPVAFDDNTSLTEGGTVNIILPANITLNDTDEENNPLSASLVTGPTNQSNFVLRSDGTYDYTHDGSQTASDSFTYRVNDGNSDSNIATVSITVNNTNDAPIALADNILINEGNSTTTLTSGNTSVIDNDSDEEGDPLTITLITGPTTDPGFSLATDGTFTYTHDGSEVTTDNFTYQINDGALDSNIATVSISTIPVNDAPALAPVTVTDVIEEILYSYQLVPSDTDDLNNGTDLSYALSNEPAGMTVSDTGLIEWLPPRTEIFNDSSATITVTLTDGGEDGVAAAIQQFTLTINPPDADSDVVADYNDNCPVEPNAPQLDTDTDGLGDACDNDPDGSGILETFIVFTIEQNSTAGNIVFINDGNITVTADLDAITGAGTVTHDWSLTDAALIGAQIDLTDNTFIFDPSSLNIGTYTIDVTIDDDGSTTHNTLLINVFGSTEPILSGTDDTDGDGTSDLDEGYADTDNDGIPDFRDSSTEAVNELSVNSTSTGASVIQSEAGTKLCIGDISSASGFFAAAITKESIELFGDDGEPAQNGTDESYAGTSEIFDFIISEIPETGATVKIILPLNTSIRPDSTYRKYSPANGWQDFIVDENNQIASASSIAGICPPPGSTRYVNGLHAFDNCLQLSLQDGGPNDSDNEINGIIRDPGVIAVDANTIIEEEDPCGQDTFNNCADKSGSIGTLHPAWLLFIALPVLYRKKYL
ncbi:MAG: hypothetical protein DIZ80_12020 [endosymbiont of Galathealinum brachiosum]|uniref:Cadherin domain-containing protein n=1 Tax=endosymbiont of Galathealinum brachiosum TaxID=2200906 RepID=A0A370DDQ6_9GAMM|nr:MAG: hypothetical protein DIZ80_12020 [endosymbiont of Galathealinum brachiosum]